MGGDALGEVCRGGKSERSDKVNEQKRRSVQDIQLPRGPQLHPGQSYCVSERIGTWNEAMVFSGVAIIQPSVLSSHVLCPFLYKEV